MNTLATRVYELYERLGNWRLVGEELGITSGHAWRIVNRSADSVKARIYFGLPQKARKALPCIRCGVVHPTRKTCPTNTRQRHRVCFEFATKEEAREFARVVDKVGRKEVSDHIIALLNEGHDSKQT